MNVRNFFQRVWEHMPLHAIKARVLGRVFNILGTIEGVGCRIEKPTNAEGRGWLVVVDGSSDIEPPADFVPPWSTPTGATPLDDDGASIDSHTRGAPAGGDTVRQMRSFAHDEASPDSADRVTALDDVAPADWFPLRRSTVKVPGEGAPYVAELKWIDLANWLSEIATRLVAAGGPWGGSGGGTAPWEGSEAIDHGDLAGLDDDDHDGPNDPYLLIGANGDEARNACDAACYIGDSTGEKAVYPAGRQLLDSDGLEALDWASRAGVTAGAVTSLDWSAQQTALADLKVDYATGDLDTEAEIITALNTTNGRINDILAALRAYKIIAT